MLPPMKIQDRVNLKMELYNFTILNLSFISSYKHNTGFGKIKFKKKMHQIEYCTIGSISCNRCR